MPAIIRRAFVKQLFNPFFWLKRLRTWHVVAGSLTFSDVYARTGAGHSSWRRGRRRVGQFDIVFILASLFPSPPPSSGNCDLGRVRGQIAAEVCSKGWSGQAVDADPSGPVSRPRLLCADLLGITACGRSQSACHAFQGSRHTTSTNVEVQSATRGRHW